MYYLLYKRLAEKELKLVMTDAATHAVRRGRHALEHSSFVAPESLALPNLPSANIETRDWRPEPKNSDM